MKLANSLCPIVEQSEIGGQTAILELGAEVVQFLAGEAAIGNAAAIALLAKFGVEAKMKCTQAIVVYRSNGETAAWIV